MFEIHWENTKKKYQSRYFVVVKLANEKYHTHNRIRFDWMYIIIVNIIRDI